MREWVERLRVGADGDDHLRGMRLGQGRRGDERFAVYLPAVELKADPLDHVEHVRVDRAGGADVVDVVPRHGA